MLINYTNSYWKSSSQKLGGIYPYYNIEDPDHFTLSFSDVISLRRKRNLAIELNQTALVTKACLPFLIGDATLIKNVNKAPWMSEYLGNNQWRPYYLPPHGNLIPDKASFTIRLKDALIAEARGYLKGKKNIGILLSGGMDSRVLAGVIREIQLRESPEIKVIGLTWGAPNSRDVVYAQRIVQKFGWDTIHYPISAEILLRNIISAGKYGAEFSAFHLHAMVDVANTPNLDVILAGSYGDSVGRAEFSGTHLTQLRPILPKVLDKYGMVNSTSLKMAKKELRRDAISSNHFLQSTSVLRQREIEQEMHYMRRMLQACMQTIAIKTPIHQLFTHPDVFGLMWGLDPKVRDDKWYALLLQQLPGNLLDIPWARNGKPYHHKDSQPLDNLSKSYHQYGKWIRNDLQSDILKRLDSNIIRNLGIFNDRGLENLIKNWQKATTTGISRIDESIMWLCSLHDMVEIYNIPLPENTYQDLLIDNFRSQLGSLYAASFIQMRNKLRN